jgi:hypothetical protein
MQVHTSPATIVALILAIILVLSVRSTVIAIGTTAEKLVPVLNSLPTIDQTETTTKHTHIQPGAPAASPTRRKHRPTKAALDGGR